MARILILSSFVAASRVGGGAQALALARLGIEPVLIPTVIFGRHPGLGSPGGGPVDAEVVSGLLRAVEAQDLLVDLDAVITGYFANPGQVEAAAAAVDAARAANQAVKVVVDPVMGDAPGGLYVTPAVAELLAALLVPRADVLAPNAWELARLGDRPVSDAASAVKAAHALGLPVLVSSLETPGGIGVAYVDGPRCWVASHAAADRAPKGTGDLLTAYFTAGLVLGLAAEDALVAATGALAEIVAASHAGADAPISVLPTRLQPSSRVQVDVLHG